MFGHQGIFDPDIDHFDGVGVLKTLVVTECLPQQPEIGAQMVASGVEMGCDPGDGEAVHQGIQKEIPGFPYGHAAAPVVEPVQRFLQPLFLLFDKVFHGHCLRLLQL